MTGVNPITLTLLGRRGGIPGRGKKLRSGLLGGLVLALLIVGTALSTSVLPLDSTGAGWRDPGCAASSADARVPRSATTEPIAGPGGPRNGNGGPLCGPITTEDCAPKGHPAEQGLTPDAVHVLRCVVATFGLTDIGGVRSQPADSDHTTGRAVDIMIPRWDTTKGNARGWQLAHWTRDDAQRLGVHYIIFDKRIWNIERDAEGWRPYTRYGTHPNPTLGHLDHVHISVYGARGTSRRG